jgi:hypothetical protein
VSQLYCGSLPPAFGSPLERTFALHGPRPLRARPAGSWFCSGGLQAGIVARFLAVRFVAAKRLTMSTYKIGEANTRRICTCKMLDLKARRMSTCKKRLCNGGGRTEQPMIEPIIEVVEREKATHRMRFRA